MKSILFIAALFLIINSFAQSQNSGLTVSPVISNNDTTNKKIIICSPSSKSLANQPLLVVDGKVRDCNYLNNLDPNNIDSINVLKGDVAVKKYGIKAITGVIVIRTKKNPILQL